MKDEKTHHGAQWINFNWNNRSVLACRYSVTLEKTDPILPPLVGLMAGRQARRKAERQNMGAF